jgi:UDP-N-acetylglucosamine 2-epimerase (non-hydrolysing)
MLGTRPEIIRLSQVIPKLDKACCHTLVHTQQSYDDNMSSIFFSELGLRQPDMMLDGYSPDLGSRIGSMISGIERDVLPKFKPDRLLVLGDTNSVFAAAYAARRRNIPVYHLEAGNRCYDKRVPEETNRVAIDYWSEVLMPYTANSRDNLLHGGFVASKIFVVGNPIYEVIGNRPDTGILEKLNLKPNAYFLVTAHREENVDHKERLLKILDACVQVAKLYQVPVIFSRHPRTKLNMVNLESQYPEIVIKEPFGIKDFLTLERHALCLLTDSGTVQEEACIMKVRCVTIRDNTERPETIECGSNILSGVEPENILNCVKVVLSREANWNPPEGYLETNVSDKVVNIVTGY